MATVTPIFSLTYLSTATEPLTEGLLEDLLVVIRRKNAVNSIAGMPLYKAAATHRVRRPGPSKPRQ